METSSFSRSVDPKYIPEGYVFPEIVEDTSTGLQKVTYPGGFSCYSPAEGEATIIYNEIMVKREYFQHGVSVEGARCVVDIGANIGIFTIAAKLAAPDAVVYSFEAIPDTHQVLEQNISLYGWSDVHAFNFAIGSQDNTEKIFTVFPHMPGNSTIHTAIKDAQKPVLDQIFGKEISDYLNQAESRVVKVRTLSSLIHELEITVIDYLKIDVEGDEFSVLEGIEDSHWPMIKQAALETHSEPLRDQVCEYLQKQGFEVYTEHGISSPAGVYDVFARRV
jgi:FkbM family methyltransferase